MGHDPRRHRILFQRDVVPALQRDEMRAGNAGGQFAAGIERLHLIIADVHDQRRHPHLRQQVGDVQGSRRLELSIRAFGAGRLALPLGEFCKLLRGPARQEQ